MVAPFWIRRNHFHGPYEEGVANHFDPESCVGLPERAAAKRWHRGHVQTGQLTVAMGLLAQSTLIPAHRWEWPGRDSGQRGLQVLDERPPDQKTGVGHGGVYSGVGDHEVRIQREALDLAVKACLGIASGPGPLATLVLHFVFHAVQVVSLAL